MDEKWSFVGRKQAHCESDNPLQGDCWDHVAFDPEHRLVVSVVPGKRTTENLQKLVEDFKRRTGGRIMDLITTDEYRVREMNYIIGAGGFHWSGSQRSI